MAGCYNKIWEDYGCNQYELMVFNFHHGKDDSREAYIKWFEEAKGKMPGVYRDDGGDAVGEALFGDKRYNGLWLIKPDRSVEYLNLPYSWDEELTKKLKDLGVNKHDCNETDIIKIGVDKGSNKNIEILNFDDKEINVFLENGEVLSVNIYTLSGKCLLKTDKIALFSGESSIPIDITNFNMNSIYIIEFRSDKHRSVFQYSTFRN